MHPSWDHKVWGNDHGLQLENAAQFGAAPSYAAKADILRLEILYQQGGVYVDADFECHYAIDSLVTGAELVLLSEGLLVTNSFIGARPEHPFIADLIAEISLLSKESFSRNHSEPLDSTGPGMLTRVLSRPESPVFSPGTRVLAPDYFVLPKTQNPRFVKQSASRRFATHHAHASWRAEGGILHAVRSTRLRTRLRRFFDLSAP